MQSRITFNTKLKIALNVIFKNNAVPIDQLRGKGNDLSSVLVTYFLSFVGHEKKFILLFTNSSGLNLSLVNSLKFWYFFKNLSVVQFKFELNVNKSL